MGRLGAMHGIAELLRERCVRIVRPEIGVVRFVAVRTPETLQFAGIGVEHHDALVAITVCNIGFIGFGIERLFRRRPRNAPY